MGTRSTSTTIATGGSTYDQIIRMIDVLGNIEHNQQALVLIARGQDVDMRGQDIDLLKQQYASDAALAAARAAAGAQVTSASISAAASMKAAAMQVAQAYEQAAQRYDIDYKQYGLAVAQQNYLQRLGVLQGTIDVINQGVNVLRAQTETAMANYTQRMGQFDARMKVAGMLADRSGPQDWVRYNNLLNGLAGPDAAATGVVDPYKWTDDLYQPISDQLPSWAAGLDPSEILAKLNQPIVAEAPRTPQMGGGESATDHWTTRAVYTQQPTAPPPPPPPVAGGTTRAMGVAPHAGGYGPVQPYNYYNDQIDPATGQRIFR